jgi:hypothetical protein
MKTVNGIILSASYASKGRYDDCEHINLRYQPDARKERRPDPDASKRPGRYVDLEVEKFPAIVQTVNVGVIKARHRKLSELCGQRVVVELDESGAMRSVDFAP